MDRNLSTQLAAIATGVGVGVAIGWLLRAKIHHSLAKHLGNKSKEMAEHAFDEIMGAECKLVIVVRSDLKMGKGKACAQSSHAAVMAYEQIRNKKPILNLWRASGQRKVVVKVDTEEELLEVEREARKAGLVTSLIRDAGHTQVSPGSRTCVGVGPGPTQLVDKVTGHLKLY
ncbi:unnamed protein product [Medioppia subpectinata]|uniref:peptidyl-tRNA hydrolase n=1 Tax=Medioppia subpectinata TaxID=1979941 RepID=A0A7R9LEJ0_9ACAR|nr:unnamed protein product [Medioppia subpectinata]CAG2118163.1 unnamed protein product [Medioppia subpectinata]